MDKEMDKFLDSETEKAKLKREKETAIAVKMLTVVGGNVIIPENYAQQLAPQPEAKQWENFLIDANTTNQKELPSVLIALILRTIPLGEIMKFTDRLSYCTSKALHYIMNHDECREQGNIGERIRKLLEEDE